VSDPVGWPEFRRRLAAVLGGGPYGEACAAEWLREALSATLAGCQDEADLPPPVSRLALRSASRALARLEGDGEYAFTVGLRGIVADAFRVWVPGLPGPPWRLDPFEEDRPSWEEWVASLDFGL
jgi:hypothetical protein